jgi:hypothetical protein
MDKRFRGVPAKRLDHARVLMKITPPESSFGYTFAL